MSNRVTRKLRRAAVKHGESVLLEAHCAGKFDLLADCERDAHTVSGLERREGETVMDFVARAVGMTPEQLRRATEALRQGYTSHEAEAIARR